MTPDGQLELAALVELAAVAVDRLVRRHALAAGVPDRLEHPQAWATTV